MGEKLADRIAVNPIEVISELGTCKDLGAEQRYRNAGTGNRSELRPVSGYPERFTGRGQS